jgi:hypothetical protein
MDADWAGVRFVVEASRWGHVSLLESMTALLTLERFPISLHRSLQP